MLCEICMNGHMSTVATHYDATTQMYLCPWCAAETVDGYEGTHDVIELESDEIDQDA